MISTTWENGKHTKRPTHQHLPECTNSGAKKLINCGVHGIYALALKNCYLNGTHIRPGITEGY